MKMKMKAAGVLSGAVMLILALHAFAADLQDVEDIKTQVVKIVASTFEGSRRVGTGFVVGMEPGMAYVLTASHVVEGSRDIQVELYTRRNRLVPARVIGLEAGDPKGLAAIVIDQQVPPEVSMLKLDSTMPVSGGDQVLTIGFPRISGVPWAVITGNIVGRKGRTITFSGAVDEGNSGGPLIRDGVVIGVVTEVAGEFAYATPALIAHYALEGWGIQLGRPSPSGSTASRDVPVEESLPSQPDDDAGRARMPDASTVLIPETGREWMVLPELMTWSGAKKEMYEIRKATDQENWHIPSREEVRDLLAAIEDGKAGPLNEMQGTFWVNEEDYKEIGLRALGKLGLFVTYVELDGGEFLQSNETQHPGTHKMLLARPINP